MSRLAGILVLLLSGSALAEEAEAPTPPPKTEEAAPAATAAKAATSSKFPLRVVKILPESEQALLFDKTRGRHVLVEVGDTVGEYTVASIDEDEVTLGGNDVPVEIVIAAPESPKKRAAAKTKKAPEDPYGEETATTTKPPAAKKTEKTEQPADPYGEDAIDEEPREVSAVDGSPANEKPIRATHWGADGSKSTTPPISSADRDALKPSEDVAKRPTDAPKATEAKMETKPPTEGPAKISKKEFKAALADFGALAAAIDGEFSDDGLELASVKAGSIFAKVGLMAGDTITAVDGKPLKTLDDAANLYARAGSMKRATVQLTRAGKSQTLKIEIQ